MSKVPFKDVLRNIQAGRVAPVYLAVGEETWGKEKLVKLLKQKLVDPSMIDFNFDQFYASEAPGLGVMDKARVLPMMAEYRLIIVDACESWKEKDLKAVSKYFENINPQCCLVLQFLTADRRKKIFRMNVPGLELIEFLKPKPWELNGYIQELAREHSLNLAAGAVDAIAEMAGDDLAKIHSELEKLSLYKLGSSNISADDVAALLGRTRAASIWELKEFMASRDLKKVLLKAQHIIDSGEHPISLLSVVNSFIKQMYTAKALLKRGVSNPQQIGQALRVPPKIASGLVNQQNSFSEVELREAFRLMRETDYMFKSAAMNPKLVMDWLLCRILAPNEFSPPKMRRRR